MAAQKFRKKPVEIEAMQFECLDSGTDIIEWAGDCGRPIRFTESQRFIPGPAGQPAQPARLHIDTLEGVMTATLGDWIIRGIQGEFYPCKPGIFAATYEPVP